MAMSSGTSLLVATIMTMLLFSGMQLYKHWLASTAALTILGGYLGSLLFVLMLTAVGNLETTLFGKGFQTKLFPEVVLCMLISMVATGMVHRVCVTTCVIFSLVALYYMNKISQKTYATPIVPTTVTAPVRKKK